jgi:hypothetical protein
LFIEFEPKGANPPFVGRFPLSEQGLSKALKLIPNVALEPGFVTNGGNVYDRVIKKKILVAKRTAEKRARPKLSDTAKSNLRNLVRGVKY